MSPRRRRVGGLGVGSINDLSVPDHLHVYLVVIPLIYPHSVNRDPRREHSRNASRRQPGYIENPHETGHLLRRGDSPSFF
jgi:hypothetical protein